MLNTLMETEGRMRKESARKAPKILSANSFAADPRSFSTLEATSINTMMANGKKVYASML